MPADSHIDGQTEQERQAKSDHGTPGVFGGGGEPITGSAVLQRVMEDQPGLPPVALYGALRDAAQLGHFGEGKPALHRAAVAGADGPSKRSV